MCLNGKIGVSGAAESGHCAIDAAEKAEQVGREIAKIGSVLVTGATTGMPYWAAKGAKEEGGMVIGLSPAASKIAHVKTYHLPLDYHDLVIYTGFDYSGRNLLLTRSVDAVIVICGRIGTLNEFTIAFEDKKPIGILQGEWETDQVIKIIIEKGHRPNERIIYDSDPRALVERVIELVEKEKQEYRYLYEYNKVIK